MATVELTTANFDEVPGRDGIVLVDFWAEWCGPCKRFAPVYERSSDKHPNIVFGKVDTEAEVEIAQAVRTRLVVQVVAVRDGVVQTGFDGPGRSMGFELLDEFPPEGSPARRPSGPWPAGPWCRARPGRCRW